MSGWVVIKLRYELGQNILCTDAHRSLVQVGKELARQVNLRMQKVDGREAFGRESHRPSTSNGSRRLLNVGECGRMSVSDVGIDVALM